MWRVFNDWRRRLQGNEGDDFVGGLASLPLLHEADGKYAQYDPNMDSGDAEENFSCGGGWFHSLLVFCTRDQGHPGYVCILQDFHNDYHLPIGQGLFGSDKNRCLGMGGVQIQHFLPQFWMANGPVR